MVDKTAVAATLVVAITVAVVGLQVMGEYPGEQSEYMNESAAWCESHDGELYNAHALAHGGLHCELSNGTTVHMSEVEAVNPT